MNYGSSSSAFANCLQPVQLRVMYVWRSCGREGRRRGVKGHNQFTNARAANPRGLPARSWPQLGLGQHTLTLDLEIRASRTACVRFLLMTDKCDVLVRSSVMHGLDRVKTKGKHFINGFVIILGSRPWFIQMFFMNELYTAGPPTKSYKYPILAQILPLHAKLALLGAVKEAVYSLERSAWE